MKTVTVYQCEGCGKVFLPPDSGVPNPDYYFGTLRNGQIGSHEWKPSLGNTWSSYMVRSANEAACIEHMQVWREKQANFEHRQELAKQQDLADLQTLVDLCGNDTLLQTLVQVKNWELARERVNQLYDAHNLRIRIDVWSAKQTIYERCFQAAGAVERPDWS